MYYCARDTVREHQHEPAWKNSLLRTAGDTKDQEGLPGTVGVTLESKKFMNMLHLHLFWYYKLCFILLHKEIP